MDIIDDIKTWAEINKTSAQLNKSSSIISNPPSETRPIFIDSGNVKTNIANWAKTLK